MSPIPAVGPLEMLIVFLLSGIGIGVPLSTPPLPPDLVLMRAAPEQCLYFLATSGTATPDPKSENQTEQFLAEPEVRQFVARLDSELAMALRRNLQDPSGQVVAEAVPVLLRTLLSRPIVLYVSHAAPQPGGVDVRGAMIVGCGADAATLRPHLAALEGILLRGRPVESTTLGGVSFHRIPTPQGAPGVVWGFKDDYLLVAVGEGSAEAALARLSPTTKMATWLTSLQEQLPVERPCVTSYINVSAALEAARPLMGSDPHIPAVLQATGLSRLKSIGSVTGLDRKSTMTKTLLATDGPPQGVFAALGSKPLSAADLAPIHKQSNMAMAVRLDLADVYRRVLEGIGQVEPDAREKVQMALGRFEEQLGVRLHDDLLQSLGDVWCLYNSPAEGGARFTGLAATVSIRDRVKIQPAHDRLIEQLRNALAGPGHTGALKEFTYRDTRVYYMQYTGTFMPIAPAWCLTKDHLVIALNPQMIKAYLSRDPQAGSLADLPQIASLVQGGRGPSMLSYQDSSGMWQVLYSYVQMVAPMASGELARQGIRFDLPELPSYAVIGRHITPTVSLARQTEAGIYSERHQSLPGSGIDLTSTGPVAIALLLPAVQAAREAARRAQGTNNMKQIGLAMHNYHDVHRHLPAAAIADKQGRPLLSWRVAILPYIEQQELYQQFKLDEPWDSEHNRKLIAKIPQVYVNPSHPELAAEGKTVYLVLASEGTLFAGPKPPRFAEVLDGTSNTLMCLEVNAERAVVWTKPDDFQVDSKDPLAGLRGARPNGFLAGLADGSVQFVSDSVDPAVLRAMFTRAGGEPIPR